MLIDLYELMKDINMYRHSKPFISINRSDK